MKPKTFFQIAGSAFILIYIILLIRKIPLYGIDSAIWYCDWIMLFAGIALLFNMRNLTSAFFVQALIVQTPWIIDTLSLSIFNYSIMGTSTYLFEQTYPIFDFILALRHFFVLPLLFIYFLYHKFNPQKKLHITTFLITYTIIMVLSLSLAGSDYNVNCSHRPCISFLPVFDSLVVHLATFFILLAAFQWWVINQSNKLIIFSKKHKKQTIVICIILFSILTIITIIKYTVR